MKNWLHFLVLFAFVRLQFVCCCGSIDHENLESQPSISQTAGCPAEMVSKCKCNHHAKSDCHAKSVGLAKPVGTERIELKSACECLFCNQGHSHLPHFFAAEHLRIASSPKVGFESLVERQSLPTLVIATCDCRSASFGSVCDKCGQNGISILCEFGHLRI